MDGIANVAKQQQTQISTPEVQGRTAQVQQTQVQSTTDVAKEMAQSAKANQTSTITTQEDVQNLVDDLNKALSPLSTNIKFGVDSQDVFYVSVIDMSTSEMIRRYPAEQASEFLPKMQEVTGMLFDTKG